MNKGSSKASTKTQSAGEANQVDSDGTSWFTQSLKGLLASIGATGLLATLGYIVHFSQEDLLGVPLGEANLAALVLKGARFVADLCLFSFASLLPLLAIALIAILTVLMAARFRKLRSRLHWRPQISAVLLLFVLFAELGMNDLPAVYISGLLFKDTSELNIGGQLYVQPPLPLPIDHVTRVLRDSVVCAREPALCKENKETWYYRKRLRWWFIINFFLTTALIVLSFGALPRWLNHLSRLGRDSQAGRSTWVVLVSLLCFGLLLNLFGLPFAYAKTIKESLFPTALIDLQAPAAENAQERYDRGEGIVPESRTPQEEIQRRPNGSNNPPSTDGNGLPGESPSQETLWQILSSDGDRFVLYHKTQGKIWSVSKEAVRIIRIEREEDVLQSYLLHIARD